MACKTCKQKGNPIAGIKDDIMGNVAKVSKIIIWVIGIWFAMGLFGLFSLIRLFL
jgi:hypothetical protein